MYQWSVLEDIGVGTIIKAVTANDDDSGDNARIVYSLRAGSPLGVFEIIPDTGMAKLLSFIIGGKIYHLYYMAKSDRYIYIYI